MERFYEALLEKAQVKRGDIIDVASDLLSVMLRFRERREAFDANRLLDALKEAVGEEGTVLIRTFNWDFCRGVPFHYKKTPSRVGSLGNTALKRPDFKRTRHALYSWCVWGREQEFLTEIDPVDSFGDDSIFAFLEDHHANLIRIGDIKSSSITNFHRAEQQAGLPVRFIKSFTGMYTGSDDVCREKTYSMFVRKLEYTIRECKEATDEIMLRRGVMLRYCHEGVLIDRIDLKAGGEVLYQDILAGRWGDWVECFKNPGT